MVTRRTFNALSPPKPAVTPAIGGARKVLRHSRSSSRSLFETVSLAGSHSPLAERRS